MIRVALALFVALALLPSAAAAQQVPQGSYLQSCTHIHMNGPMLRASCNRASGGTSRSTLDVSTCRGGDIANNNGNLTCNRSYGGGNGYYRGGRQRHGGGYAMPAGSYQQSCQNVMVSGSVLSGTCTAANGALIRSSLDVNRCQPGSDIANINGRITCMRYR